MNQLKFVILLVSHLLLVSVSCFVVVLLALAERCRASSSESSRECSAERAERAPSEAEEARYPILSDAPADLSIKHISANKTTISLTFKNPPIYTLQINNFHSITKYNPFFVKICRIYLFSTKH